MFVLFFKANFEVFVHDSEKQFDCHRKTTKKDIVVNNPDENVFLFLTHEHWPASWMLKRNTKTQSDPHLNSETRRPATIVKNPHLWKSCIFAPKSCKNAGDVSETLFFKILRCLLPSTLCFPYGDWWSVSVTSIAFTQTVCL